MNAKDVRRDVMDQVRGRRLSFLGAVMAVAMSEKSHMVMAGLWDEGTDKKTGERVKSCTIITWPANALVGTLHDRMPVILAETDWAKWLGVSKRHRIIPCGGRSSQDRRVHRSRLGRTCSLH